MEGWYDDGAFEATSGAYRAELWLHAVDALKAHTLAADVVLSAIDFVMSIASGEDRASAALPEVRSVVDAGPNTGLRTMMESYAEHPDPYVAAMARSYLVDQFRDERFWHQAVSSLRSGSASAKQDASTIYRRGRAGDAESRSIIEEAIADGATSDVLLEHLIQILYKPRRFTLWRKRFYAALSGRCGIDICPLDPYGTHRALATAGTNYTLVTSIADGVSIKLTTHVWQLLISIALVSPAGEIPLGSAALDRGGIERAAALVVEALTAAIRPTR